MWRSDSLLITDWHCSASLKESGYMPDPGSNQKELEILQVPQTRHTLHLQILSNTRVFSKYESTGLGGHWSLISIVLLVCSSLHINYNMKACQREMIWGFCALVSHVPKDPHCGICQKCAQADLWASTFGYPCCLSCVFSLSIHWS